STRATSTSCRCRTAATASTTRRAYPTRVTSSARSSYHRAEVVALGRAQLLRAPPPLHAVHRVVRLAQQRAGLAARTADRDAEARRQLQLVRDPLRCRGCLLLVRLRQEDGELVAADAEGVVAGSHRGAQRIRDALDRLVAGCVSVRVVQGLQLVEVEDHERERTFVAAAARDLGVEVLHERA